MFRWGSVDSAIQTPQYRAKTGNQSLLKSTLKSSSVLNWMFLSLARNRLWAPDPPVGVVVWARAKDEMKTAYVDNSDIGFWLLGGLGEERKERLGKYEGPKVTSTEKIFEKIDMDFKHPLT